MDICEHFLKKIFLKKLRDMCVTGSSVGMNMKVKVTNGFTTFIILELVNESLFLSLLRISKIGPIFLFSFFKWLCPLMLNFYFCVCVEGSGFQITFQ